MKFRNDPWLTRGTRNSIKTKNALHKIHQKAFSDIKYTETVINSCAGKVKKLYYNNLFETNKVNPKKVWQGINDFLRRKKNSTFSLTKIIATAGRIISDSNEMCNYVNDYFSTIGSRIWHQALVSPLILIFITDL